MSTRRIAKRPLHKSAIGDRRDRIKIHVRSLTAPVFESAVFREAYDAGIETWAKVESVALVGGGRRQFDSIQIAEDATHLFDIRYRLNVTMENIIGYRGEYYEVLKVDDPEERHMSLILHARVKGDDTAEANQ